MKRTGWIIVAIIVLLGVGGVWKLTRPTPSATPTEAPAERDPLALSAPERKTLGIVVAPVRAQMLSQVDTAPGEVQADQYRVAQVAARVKSQVITRYAKLGDRLARGAPLVTLSSTEMADAHGQLVLAAKEWRRVRELGPDIVSQKRYEEAEVALAGAQARVEAFGMSAADAGGLVSAAGARRANGRFTLYAPQAGTVLRDDFVLGQEVEPGTVLFQLADEAGLWVEAQVPSDHALGITPQSNVEIAAGDGGSPLLGTVLRIAPTVSEATRTRAVRIAVDNSAGRLHVGDFVGVRLSSGAPKAQLVVPERAVVLLNGVTGVFVVEGDSFAFRPLELAPAKDGWSQVLQGVVAGEPIVVQGAFVLKSRVLKGTLTDTD
jgi:cobalt-zinc-cadmium efflux system membrane fusion protein